jgi:hypothetical protein
MSTSQYPSPDARVYFYGSVYGPDDAEGHRRFMEDLRAMTPKEFFQTLVDAGVYTPDGHLTPPYADDDAEDNESL